jgi:hypothetical protein
MAITRTRQPEATPADAGSTRRRELLEGIAVIILLVTLTALAFATR